jgi:glycosyltransferase involved in cell wall biosynthesis
VKVLVFPHHLEIGGSQTNAIDLATAVRDRHGHDVVFCATPGPARKLIADRGFRLIELCRPRAFPSPTRAAQVYQVARRERPDLIHAYDNAQILEAFYGAHLVGRVPMLATNMSMTVQRMLPRTVPLTYGTAELADEASRSQRAPVWLLEPPVDTDEQAPGAVDPAPFRQQWKLDDGSLTVVVVSRLVSWLKAESMIEAIEAVGRLTPGRAVHLVIVGGGTLFDDLSNRAEKVNQAAGRTAVTLTGPLLDPRPAYAAADIVIGMGGSILRGMAFAKPAIVLGEGGFSEIFSPETAPQFLREGLYGLGGGRTPQLEAQLARLIDDADLRASLADFARSSVIDRYGLATSGDALDGMYNQTLAYHQGLGGQLVDAALTVGRRVAVDLPDPIKEAIRRRGRRV